MATSAPLLEVVRASGLNILPEVFAFIALVAVANGALLTMIMASRLTYGMAGLGLLPAPLAKVLPKRRTPGTAILASTLLAVALTLTGTLAALAQTVVLLLLSRASRRGCAALCCWYWACCCMAASDLWHLSQRHVEQRLWRDGITGGKGFFDNSIELAVADGAFGYAHAGLAVGGQVTLSLQVAVSKRLAAIAFPSRWW